MANEPTSHLKEIEEVVATARMAEEAMRRLAHLTIRPPIATPAEIEPILTHLAETVAGIPQVAAQVAYMLDTARNTFDLAMDGMVEATEPDLVIDTARHHLTECRDSAVDTYRRLNAARNDVAHISATPPASAADAGASHPPHALMGLLGSPEAHSRPDERNLAHPPRYGPGR